MQTWFKLKIKYFSKRWLTKYNIFNRLKQINYFSSKDINNLDVKIVKILEKIKKLDITIKKMVTIKLMNNLSSLFEIYLTLLS